MTDAAPVTIIVMGVSGCGKTTVGRALADRLGWAFADADDFHPPANVEKMSRGKPLTDADRWPWLDRMAREIRDRRTRGAPAVLTCSALRQAYRDRLGLPDPQVALVHLVADPALVRERVAGRADHFMPASLVESQFDTLEPPADAIDIDAATPVDQAVEQILARIGVTDS